MQHDIKKSSHASATPRVVTTEKKQHKLTASVKKRWVPIVVVVAVIVIGLLSYGYVSTRGELARLSDPKAAAQAEAEDLAKEVGKFLELPSDETPTLATVSDVARLKDQPFFSKAKNGDRVLVYSKAQRAVLYRPSTKKVIEYAPVSLQ